MAAQVNEQTLLLQILDPELADDPEAFVMFAFPWGVPGTPLERFKGPRAWQRRQLRLLRDYIREMQANNLAGAEEKMRVFRKAIASGRGIGKSALVAWIIFWFLSTRIGGTAIVSANTEAQLRTITWGELGKWHTMLVNKHWFDLSATSIRPAKWFDELVQGQLRRGTKYYYAEAKLWSEENPDAYAGAHNPLGMLLVFDEASGIPKPIWTVADGYFTEPGPDRYWLAFSNPRKPDGAFFDCFNLDRDFWDTEHIDSRTVEGTDKAVYDKIIAQYGDDSDEARVEVKGEFPRAGDNQLIGDSLAREAMQREPYEDPSAPVIVGVDVARFGADKTVIAVRKGRNLIYLRRHSGLDTMAVVGEVVKVIETYNPLLTNIDEGGLGAGVVDRLQEQRYKVRGVNFGQKADDARYVNKRTEMWALGKEWLATASIPFDKDLLVDFTGPRYKYDSYGAMVLEKKEDMKKRGLASPDAADAVMLTFAFPVARKSTTIATQRPISWGAATHVSTSWMN